MLLKCCKIKSSVDSVHTCTHLSDHSSDILNTYIGHYVRFHYLLTLINQVQKLSYLCELYTFSGKSFTILIGK